METATREKLLELVNAVPMSAFNTILSELFLARVIINPYGESPKLCFTDSMKSLIGETAELELTLEQFVLNVPEDMRSIVYKDYSDAINALMSGDKKNATINHIIDSSNYELIDISVSLFKINLNDASYIVGLISDISEKIVESAFVQLFGEGTNSYLFTYDVERDVCFVSDRFVHEFDLPSRKIIDFSKKYSQYIHPDDEGKLKDAFIQFKNTHLVEADMEIRFMAPRLGQLHLRVEGFSDAGSDGNFGGDRRFISGVFSDVTNYIQDAFFTDNLIDSADAFTFNADLETNSFYFSENVHQIFPDISLQFQGDFIDIIAQRIVSEDRSRFVSALNSVVTNIGSKFQVEIRVKSSDGKIIWVACRGKSVEDRVSHSKFIVGLAFDLTRMNELKEHVERHNVINELSGLPTREKLNRDARNIIRNRNTLSAAIILIDINEFHSLNDRYGWKAGDSILKELAIILKRMLPENSKLYHIGVDTFAVLWSDATSLKVSSFMNDLQEYSRKPLTTDKGEFFVSLAVSAAFYPTGTTVEELMTNAEIALHKVKQDKKLKNAIYSPVDMHELKERVDFEFQITSSIRNNMENFQLYYQPLINAQTNEVVGAEALLRWQAPNGELVNPEKVVEALESTDQMEVVGSWILNEAIKQVAKWRSTGAPEDFFVHINATADDLVRLDYVKAVLDRLETFNVPAKNILIELTETSLMKNMAICRKNIRKLHENSIKTALDDFGSGYSSFNYLKELPVNEIKIDKTFVDDMDKNAFNRSFIEAMTKLAHSIDKKVVVEGVENEEQVKALKEMNVDIFQGYYFGKPMSVFAFYNHYFS